jgi:hypothetical protein
LRMGINPHQAGTQFGGGMFGWLAKKGEDARVFMCVKEVKWELEKADGVRRATILLIAQYFRLNMEKEGLENRVFDNPFAYTRTEMLQFYSGLEVTRNNMVRGHEHTNRMMQPLSGWPDYAARHSRNAIRGMEVWMCNTGAAVAPAVRDDIRLLWNRLNGSKGFLTEAIKSLREVERMTESATGVSGGSGGIPDALSVDEWPRIASFVPSVFRTE